MPIDYMDKNSIKQLAASFYNAGIVKKPDFTIIDKLCEIAVSSDISAAQTATAAIFQQIIEKLCDDFSTPGTELCNQVIAHLLDFIRKQPGGKILNRSLTKLGLTSSHDILQRYKNIAKPRKISKNQRQKVRKIIILSRVTAGADIAVTSVIVQRLVQTFPQSKITIIGPSHLEGMFQEIPGVDIYPFLYKNDGTLLDKLTTWPQIFAIVQQLQAGYAEGEILLFDPDSRLTQLGLLPLLSAEHTFFFPSRLNAPRNCADKDLSFLTNKWLNNLLDEDQTNPPSIQFNSEGSGYNAFCRSLKKNGCQFIVTINFGVGNDPRKKILPPFEENLVIQLLETPKTIVILDTGRGPLEYERVRSITKIVQEKNLPSSFIHQDEIREQRFTFSHGLITFKGSIESLGKLISASDCFIGYDSCAQHLAAATGTPAVIIFAGAPSTRFIKRWAPAALNNKTIPVSKNDRVEDTLSQCTKELNNIRRKQCHP